MAKESKHRKDARKKPTMTLKERRMKKHQKREQKHEHFIDEEPHIAE